MAHLDQVRKGLPQDDPRRQALDFIKTAADGKLAQYLLNFNEQMMNPAGFSHEILPLGIISYGNYYLVDVTREDGEIYEAINSSIQPPEIFRDGFEQMTRRVSNSVLSAQPLGELSAHHWLITVEYGALIRVDVLVWRYDFPQPAAMCGIKNICCFLVVKSFALADGLKASMLPDFVAKSLGLTADEISSDSKLKNYVDLMVEFYQASQGSAAQ